MNIETCGAFRPFHRHIFAQNHPLFAANQTVGSI